MVYHQIVLALAGWLGKPSVIDLFVFYWNFVNKFQRMGSPAMLEGIADHVWT